MASARPTRTIQPSAKLLSTDNDGDIELSFHRKAIAAATAKHSIPSTSSLEPVRKLLDSHLPTDSHEPSKSTPPLILPVSSTQNLQSPTNLAVTGQSTDDDIELDDTPLPTINKHYLVDSESENDVDQPAPSQDKTRKGKKRARQTGKAKLYPLIRWLVVDRAFNSR